MRRVSNILLLFFVSAAFAQATISQKSQILEMPQELKGELPWFAMAVENNGQYDGVVNNNILKDIVKDKSGKGVVLSFYATWCVPCREGLKRMNEKAEELKNKGLLIVLVNVGEEDYGKINEYIKQYAKPDWLLGFDRFANIPEKFGLSKEGQDMVFPKTLVLDSALKPVKLIGVEGEDYTQILWNDL